MSLPSPPSQPPLIVITPDCTAPSFASERQYVLRMNYAAALERAGALPVILPYLGDSIDEIIARFDGFVISGTTPGVFEVPARTSFEKALIAAALAAQKPLLGICNGMQLIGLALGGKFISDIAALENNTADHLPHPVPDQPAHSVSFREGGWLHRLTGVTGAKVNSLHRQAIDASGNYNVEATADDGMVEAIAGTGDSFVGGIQWHPEYGLDAADHAIFAGFVKAAAACRRQEPRDR